MLLSQSCSLLELNKGMLLKTDLLFILTARLDYGNEELVVKLKTQLKETHQELEDTRKELDKSTQAADEFQQEVQFIV